MKRSARSAPPPPRAPLSTIVFGALLLVLGIVTLAGGGLRLGIGFAAMGAAGLLGSPQAHALLGVDYRQRWTPLRVAALVLVAVSLGAFVAMFRAGVP